MKYPPLYEKSNLPSAIAMKLPLYARSSDDLDLICESIIDSLVIV